MAQTEQQVKPPEKPVKPPKRGFELPKNMVPLAGIIAFVASIALALVGGIVAGIVHNENSIIILVLVIMGIIVGVLNITAKEMVPLLIAAIALVVAGTGAFSPLDDIVKGLGEALNWIVSYIAVFMIPAAVINAIRLVWSLARPG